jgi:hypothetical protein
VGESGWWPSTVRVERKKAEEGKTESAGERWGRGRNGHLYCWPPIMNDAPAWLGRSIDSKQQDKDNAGNVLDAASRNLDSHSLAFLSMT